MKINWKLRLQNKATLTTLILGVIAIVYQILGALGVVPALAENAISQIVVTLIDLCVIVGVVVDPTTQGLGDSQQALTYAMPKKSIVNPDEEAEG